MEPPILTSGAELNAPGDNPIESTVICVITRFGLRHPICLLQTYLDLRRMMKGAKSAVSPWALAWDVSREDTHTRFSVSSWRD
jgi:hypothetical protein